MNQDSIIRYLNELNPLEPQEVAKTSAHIKQIMTALFGLINRVNLPRKNKLCEQEADQLKTEITNISSSIEQARVANEEIQKLTKQWEALLTQRTMILDLARQKSEIEQLIDFVAKHDLSVMKQEVQGLQEKATGDIAQLNTWLNEANSLLVQLHGNFTHQTQDLLKKIAKNREQIDTVLKNAQGYIALEQTHLSDLLQQYNNEFSAVHHQYNALAQQLTSIKLKIQEVDENHSKNVAIYLLHFSENKAIYGELGAQHNVDNHIQNLFGEVENKLNQFDLKIKKLVEQSDQMSIF